MKVIGVDPGTRVVGYSVLGKSNGNFITYTYGAINTKNQKTLPTRLKIIYQSLMAIIEEHAPQVMAIEKVFYGKNIQSAIKIGEARGVALLAAANAGIDVYEYDATKIKKSVVGTGAAHKTQVQSMVKAILALNELPQPADAADALAIAICHHNSYRA